MAKPVVPVPAMPESFRIMDMDTQPFDRTTASWRTNEDLSIEQQLESLLEEEEQLAAMEHAA